jgi:hypothetical protein
MEETVASKLAQALDLIRGCADRNQAAGHWKTVFALLKKTEVPANRAANVVAGRNLAELEKIVAAMSAGATLAAPAPGAGFDSETLKAAMKMIRRRLKFTRLDEESRLGVGPIGGGHRKKITCVMAPPEYPTAVWEELVRLGQLRHAGKGFYEVVGDEAEAE